MKTVFKVSELAHAFFNQLAIDGATAGVNACVVGHRLQHDTRVVAAGFLQDARDNDGRRVVVIAPTYNDNDSRWNPITLQAAVPPSLAHLKLDAWPEPCTPRGMGPILESVQDLTLAYLDAIHNACHASIHCAADHEGSKPTGLPAYASAVVALLALQWDNAVLRAGIAAQWETTRDYWQLSDAGEYDLTIVRAIAQRARIVKDAREALPTLRDYFAERASVNSLATRLALTDKFSVSKLDRCIAELLRAGIPETEKLPANMRSIVAADFAKVERAEKMRRMPGRVRMAWRDACQGDAQLARMHQSHTMPARFNDELKAAAELAFKVSNRKQNKDAIAKFAHGMNRAESALNVIFAVPLQDATSTVKACEVVSRWANEWGDNFVNGALSVGRITPAHPLLHTPEFARWSAVESRNSYAACAACAETLARSMHEAALKIRQDNKAAELRASIAAAVERASLTPRASLTLLKNTLAQWRYSQANAAVGDHSQALQDEVTAAVETVREMADAITPQQEWRNGGESPGSGDWLRVNGKRATTTRGVEVSTAAIVRAFDWIDMQPAGMIRADLEISGYRMTSRSEAGTVTVGCHTFSADSVADIRAQIAQQ